MLLRLLSILLLPFDICDAKHGTIGCCSDYYQYYSYHLTFVMLSMVSLDVAQITINTTLTIATKTNTTTIKKTIRTTITITTKYATAATTAYALGT